MATYKPGSIKSIKLVNFMCHSSFEISFGPHINFVIGPNGSGKSALLTALVVALGGRATTTNRAKKLEEFIKYGERTARVIVTLHNYEKIMDKSLAYKPDDYGRVITVEKTLLKDGAARLTIRDEHKRIVSERKAELDEMLDHFNILINNPICILNQEVSKTFLHSKRPEDKFDLFMKATMIEQIETDYNASHQIFKEWKNMNEHHKVSFTLLDNEYKSCEEKMDFLQKRAKIDEEVARLQLLAMWAHARDTQLNIDEVTKKVKTSARNIDDIKNQVSETQIKVDIIKESLSSSDSKLEMINESIDEAKTKFDNAKIIENDVVRQKSEADLKLSSITRKIKDYIQQKFDLEKKIDNLKQQLRERGNNGFDKDKRKLEIVFIESELTNLNCKEKTTRLHADQLEASLAHLRNEISNLLGAKNTKSSDMARNRELIQRLLSSKNDHITRFGLHMKEILEAIRREKSFTRTPLGPLGFHVKLKDPECATALEACLGPASTSFICDNQKDMALLKSIFRMCAARYPNFKQPNIITRSFTRRHDVSRLKSSHPNYPTIMDYVEIENDYIFNALVDKANIEMVLFIPDYREAQSLMMDASSIPPNTLRAYTKTGDSMFPISSKSGYKSYAYKGNNNLFQSEVDTRIVEVKKQLEKDQAKLNQIEQSYKALQDSQEVQRRELTADRGEISRIGQEIREKERVLLEAKMALAHYEEPIEISVHEEELEKLIALIANLKSDAEIARQTVSELTDKVKEKEQHRIECRKLLDTHEASKRKFIKDIDEKKASIDTHKHTIISKEKEMEAKSKEKESLEAELKQKIEKLEELKADLKPPKPSTIPKTSDVMTDLNIAKHRQQIDKDNMQDPEELRLSIIKRMAEIESSREHRDLNVQNTDMMNSALESRVHGFKSLRSATFSKVSTSFSSVMKSMNMTGMLDIYLDDVVEDGVVVKKARTLDICVDTHNAAPTQRVVNSVMSDSNVCNSSRSSTQPLPSTSHSRAKRARRCDVEGGEDSLNVSGKENDRAKMSDSRSLSGGERSFSTVAFVLSLWHHCVSPFKLMDEIDVFMDLVTRRQSYNALISFANATVDPGQFIFFSPLEAPKLTNIENVRIFEMPVIVRKGSHEVAAATAPNVL